MAHIPSTSPQVRASPRALLEGVASAAIASGRVALANSVGKNRARILASVTASLDALESELLKAVRHEVSERVQCLGISEGGLLQGTLTLVFKTALQQSKNTLLSREMRAVRVAMHDAVTGLIDNRTPDLPLVDAASVEETESETSSRVTEDLPVATVASTVAAGAETPSPGSVPNRNVWKWDNKEFRENYVPQILMRIAGDGLMDLYERITMKLRPPALTEDEHISDVNFLLLGRVRDCLARWMIRGAEVSADHAAKDFQAFKRTLVRKLDGVVQSVEDFVQSPDVRAKPQRPHPDLLNATKACIAVLKTKINTLEEGEGLADFHFDASGALPQAEGFFLPKTVAFLEERYVDPGKRWAFSEQERSYVQKSLAAHRRASISERELQVIADGLNEDFHGGISLEFEGTRVCPVALADVQALVTELRAFADMMKTENVTASSGKSDGGITASSDEKTPEISGVDQPDAPVLSSSEVVPPPPVSTSDLHSADQDSGIVPTSGPVSADLPPAPQIDDQETAPSVEDGGAGQVDRARTMNVMIPGAATGEPVPKKAEDLERKERGDRIRRIIDEELRELIADRVWPTEREIQRVIVRINQEAYGAKGVDYHDPLPIEKRRHQLLQLFSGVKAQNRYAIPVPLPDDRTGTVAEYDPSLRDKLLTEYFEVDAEVDAVLDEGIALLPSRIAIIAGRVSKIVYGPHKIWKFADLETFIDRRFKKKRGKMPLPKSATAEAADHSSATSLSEGIPASAGMPALEDARESDSLPKFSATEGDTTSVVAESSVSGPRSVASAAAPTLVPPIVSIEEQDSANTSVETSPVNVADVGLSEEVTESTLAVSAPLLEFQRRMQETYHGIHTALPKQANLDAMGGTLAQIQKQRATAAIECNRLDQRLYKNHAATVQACERQEHAKTIDPDQFAADRALLTEFSADLQEWDSLQSVTAVSLENELEPIERQIRSYNAAFNALRGYRKNFHAVCGDIAGLDLSAILGVENGEDALMGLDGQLHVLRDQVVSMLEASEDATLHPLFDISEEKAAALRERVRACLAHMDALLQRILHPTLSVVPITRVAATPTVPTASAAACCTINSVKEGEVHVEIDPEHQAFIHRILAIVTGPKEVGNNGNGLSLASRITRILETFDPQKRVPAECVVDKHDAPSTSILRQYADVSPEAEAALLWLSNGRERDKMPDGKLKIDAALLAGSAKPFLLHFNHKGNLVLAATAVGKAYAARNNIVLSHAEIENIMQHLQWPGALPK